VLKTGEVLRYRDGEVETGAGYRIRIRRNATSVDSLDAADVERWFVEASAA
jgi:hypothetical protein